MCVFRYGGHEFSSCQTHHDGEGGAVLTNDKELGKKLSCFRSHGITSAPDEFFYRENAFEGGDVAVNPWYYEQNCLGYNYRITDIQCALGISQLRKLEMFRQKRQEILCQYNNAFKGIEQLKVPYEENFCDSNFHLYVLQFDFKKIGMTRAQVMTELKKREFRHRSIISLSIRSLFYRKNFGTQWGIVRSRSNIMISAFLSHFILRWKKRM